MSATNIDIYLSELEVSKRDIKGAIQAKGVTPTGGLSSYAEAILSIPTGTEMAPLNETIIENGVYNYNPIDDGVGGYNSVEINVDIPIPTFETQSKEVTIKKNGTTSIVPDSGYDGLSKVDVTVQVASGGSDKPQIFNGFRFTGGDIAQVDFSQYDWSLVYDTSEFFKGCTHSTGDWSNFEENFNGEVLSLREMFAGSSARPFISVKTLPNLGDKTSDATSTVFMCAYNANLDDASALSQWDTSKVIDASYMFGSDGSLTAYNPKITSIDLTNFGSPDGYKADYMFGACGSLESVIGARPAGGASCMFRYCNKLTTIPQLDTSKVTDMSSMFNGCSNLTTIPQLDTSKVTDMSNMFRECQQLTTIPQLDTSKVTDMGYMFYNCNELTTIPQMDTSKVTNMGYMFYKCDNLTTIPQMDISEVTSVNRMFAYCSNITELRFKGNPSKITDTSSMFYVVYTTGTFYYDERYDYSVIINIIPSTWTVIPYNVEEYENNM